MTTTTAKISKTRMVLYCLITLSASLLLQPKIADAAVTLNPDPDNSTIPAYYENYLRGCDSRGYSPSLVQWVSPDGSRSSESATVPAGTTSINLRFNYAGAVCYSTSKVSAYNIQIQSSSVNNGASISGLTGDTGGISFSPYNSVGKYANSSFLFTISKSGGFTTGTYSITVRYRGINSRVIAPSYQCTTTGAAVNTTNSSNYGPCPDIYATYNFYVTSQSTSQLPTGTVSATCSGSNVAITVRGYTYNGESYDARLIVNGVEQSGSGLIQGIPSGSSRTFYYSGSTARNYQVRIHDPGVGSTTVGPASAGPCGTVVTPVSCNISATPSSITAGGSSTLQWNTTGSPTGASINNGVGSVNVTSGTRSVSPSSTTTYTLTVSKSGVPNATCSRTVTVVNEPAPTPVSCSLTANPPVINPGGSSTLTWTTGGSPTSATINQGVGSVSPPAGGSRGVSPGGTTNYTLIVSKSGVPNANCSATVTIDACPNIPGNQVNTNGYIVDGLGNCQAYDEPYFRVFGGDVSVGGEFQSSTGCTTNSGAGILAFNNHPSGAGSAGQLAAFAMNHIVGFTSATGRIADPRPARGLSFSNTAGDSTYGGSFGTASCPADYFSKEIDPSYTITDLAGGTDTLTSVSVANGSKVVYKKSAGSLVINGSGINFGSTNWSNVGEIPSVYVIVDGDIYIDPSVTQLDGIYIARGSIYTCAPGASTYSAAALATAGCGNKLTVNGSFIAKQVKLLRTGGDIGSSTLTETPASPSVAEVFTYSPEVFFHSPFVRPEPYQSITNLPPVL